MSYCVNCGVELDKSAHKCALCDTPVYNPTEKSEESSVPFSHTPDIPVGVKQKLVALVVSFAVLIPNIVCVFMNLFLSPENLWFIYVVATSLLLWILFVFPFFTKRLRPYLMWAFDTLAVALYVFVFHATKIGDPRWYVSVAIPIISIISSCVLFFIFWYRKRKRHWTSKVLHVFIDLTVSLLISSYGFFLGDYIAAYEATLTIGVCCLALMFFWLYVNKSKKVRAWLSKKMFV